MAEHVYRQQLAHHAAQSPYCHHNRHRRVDQHVHQADTAASADLGPAPRTSGSSVSPEPAAAAVPLAHPRPRHESHMRVPQVIGTFGAKSALYYGLGLDF